MMFLCFCVKNNKNNKKIGRLCYIIIYVTKQTMSIFGEPTKYIHFNNDTDLPVLIDAWISNDHGTMSTLVTTRIAPFESKLLYSSVGEWHMNAMFYDDTDKAVWKERGLLQTHFDIGKFRSDPCIMGNYSWMEYKHFICQYADFKNENEPQVKGQMTFSISNELCFMHSYTILR